MSSKMLWLITLLACALKFSSTQSSCRGRCGAEYYRGNMCQCDYSCLSFDECCRDFESQCTTKNSCKGRCGETFRRGRPCTCDSECLKFNHCCPDYKAHCDADESTLTEDLSPGEGNDADDNSFTPDGLTSDQPNDVSDDLYAEIFPGPDTATDGVADLQASPGPEISSGDGLAPTDAPDKNSTEASQAGGDPDVGTEIPLSLTDATPTDDILTPTTTASAVPDPQDPTTDPDEATILYEPTAAPEAGTLEPSSSSAPQKEPTASSGVTETEEEVFPPGKPEDTGTNTQDLTGELENFQPTTTSASSTLASLIPSEEATSSPNMEISPGNDTTSSPEVPQDINDPLSPLISVGDPSTAAPNPNKVTDGVEPDATAADLLTSDPDLSTASPPSKPNPNPDPSEASPPSKPNPDLSTASPPSKPNPDLSTASPSSKPDPNPDLSEASPPSKPNPDLSTASPPSKLDPNPDPSAASPTSKPETKPLHPQTQILDNLRDYQGDDSDDTNLCSGRPISGLTTLRNGTMVVFRGHYFWFLDRNLVPSAPKGITEVWGVPSPIDTVFTRCNCQGKTYIFKGGRYWRFENDALDPGYPRIIKTGFDGLQGHITAALSVPQYLRRKETVYFFKRGGMVQKYSYQVGPGSKCGNTAQNPLYTVRARMVRQAVSVLEPAIKIQKSWRGFPSTITAAVSLPTNQDPEGYKYIVFSRSSAYNVKMQGGQPVVAAPRPNVSPKTNNFFRCPKKS